MNSVLYLVTKSAQTWEEYQFLLPSGQKNEEKTVVLMENTPLEEGVSVGQCYCLSEGRPEKNSPNGRNNAPKIPSISYRDLLDLIFSSDHSVVV